MNVYINFMTSNSKVRRRDKELQTEVLPAPAWPSEELRILLLRLLANILQEFGEQAIQGI